MWRWRQRCQGSLKDSRYSLVNLEKNNEKSEFYGKIAILAFTVIGTVTFLILQIAWYRKFFEKLRRVNREIEVEIGENIKKKTLSTICKSNWIFLRTSKDDWSDII